MPQIEVNDNPGYMTVADAKPGDIGYIDGDLYMTTDEASPDNSNHYIVVSLEDGFIGRAAGDEVFSPLPPGASVTLTVE